jgi:hypothetical protein
MSWGRLAFTDPPQVKTTTHYSAIKNLASPHRLVAVRCNEAIDQTKAPVRESVLRADHSAGNTFIP